MSEEIEKIRVRIAELNVMIEPMEEERAKLVRELDNALSPFKVGDMVRWGRGKVKKTGRVISVNNQESSIAPRWIVIPILKSGVSGLRKTLFAWDKVELLSKGADASTIEPQALAS